MRWFPAQAAHLKNLEARPALMARIALTALAAFVVGWCPAMARAQRAQDLGTVTPSAYSTLSIAVPPFQVEGSRGFEEALLAEIVANDLKLSGFFNLDANEKFVKETHALDLAEDRVHFPDWARLGVSYIVKGKYKVDGLSLEAEVRTYDATAGTYIFGKRYPGYSAGNPRELAHRISNDIHQRVTGWPGIAHTKLIYVQETAGRAGKQSKEAYIIDADGKDPRKLTSDLSLIATPTWGANATELYYTTYKDFNPDLAGSFIDGSYNWFVSRWPGFNLSPAWSQKKRMIALTLTKDGNSEIYLITREGKGPGGRGPKRLTYDRAIDSSPTWSPGGNQIAFTSDRSGSPQIFVMDDTGVNVRRMTRPGAPSNYCDGAAWSPRGDKIAFAARVDGIFQIFTISPTGEDLEQLTRGESNHEDPSWAPNGWVLSYTGERGGSKEIRTMFVDGRPIARLTSGSDSYSSSWSPMLP